MGRNDISNPKGKNNWPRCKYKNHRNEKTQRKNLWIYLYLIHSNKLTNMNLIFICISKLSKTTAEFFGAKSLMNLYLHVLNSRKANNDLIQWAKIFLVSPNGEISMVLSNYSFFKYCHSSIKLFSIASCKVSDFYFFASFLYFSLYIFV